MAPCIGRMPVRRLRDFRRTRGPSTALSRALRGPTSLRMTLLGAARRLADRRNSPRAAFAFERGGDCQHLLFFPRTADDLHTGG